MCIHSEEVADTAVITRVMRDTQSSRSLQLGRRKAKPLMDIMPTVSGMDTQIHWGGCRVHCVLHCQL